MNAIRQTARNPVAFLYRVAMRKRRTMRCAGALSLIAIGWPVLLPAHPNHGITRAPEQENMQPVGISGNARGEARLSVTILDAKTGMPTPVRVRITDERGRPVGSDELEFKYTDYRHRTSGEARLAVPGSVVGLPAEAIGVMYGAHDLAYGYAFQPNGAFYVNGAFDMPMPAGKFFVSLSKGFEVVGQTEGIVIKAGDHLSRTYTLRRWIDMPERGWYSADDHIHLRRSPRENPLIRDWIAAEDIHVGILLQMGDFLASFFPQYAWGEKGRYSSDGYTLTSGQEEPRTDELGHTISFGADKYVRFRDDYYFYDQVFDQIHSLGGVSGYAHSAESFHGYRGMTLDVLAGKIDFLEVLQFCVPQGPLAVDRYYQFLDLGYKLTALAGSDFPWCGIGTRAADEEQVGPQIGNVRFYTYLGQAFSFDRWLEGVKAGKTFVTSGPMLVFEVNGETPGSSLDVKPGTKLHISATAYGHPSQIPLKRLQIIGHGKILAEVNVGEAGQDSGRLSVDFELVAEHGIWLAARTDAGVMQIAHTTPVYVTVNGDGFQNRENLASRIEIAKGYLQEIREVLHSSAGQDDRKALFRTPLPSRYPGATERLEGRIAEAEAKLDELSGRP